MLSQRETATLYLFMYEGWVAADAATSMQPSVPPIVRSECDEVTYSATRFTLGRDTWGEFQAAVKRFLRLARSAQLQLSGGANPLVLEEILHILCPDSANFRDAPIRGGEEVMDEFSELGEQLMDALGGDPLSADVKYSRAANVFANTIASRMVDGFVHPAVGAWIWAEDFRGNADLTPAAATVSVELGNLVEQWIHSPSDRPDVERQLVMRASPWVWDSLPS